MRPEIEADNDSDQRLHRGRFSCRIWSSVRPSHANML